MDEYNGGGKCVAGGPPLAINWSVDKVNFTVARHFQRSTAFWCFPGWGWTSTLQNAESDFLIRSRPFSHFPHSRQQVLASLPSSLHIIHRFSNVSAFPPP